MKKILILILASILLLTSCAAKPAALGTTSSAATSTVNQIENDNDTITVRMTTPFIILSQSYYECILTDNTNRILYYPIKSYKILQNVGNVNLNLKKVESDNEFSYKQDYFNYYDKSKYSTFEMKLDNHYLEKMYGNNYTNVLYVVFELELYKSEIKPEVLKNFETQPVEKRFLGCNDTWYILQNPYMGDCKTFLTANTNKLDPKEFERVVTSTLDSTYRNMFTEYTQSNDPNFIKAVEEIKKELKSDKTQDKARAIYEWVSTNIEYDESSVSMISDIQDYNEDAVSVKNALSKRKSICLGYSYTFDALAKYFGVNSYVVSGIGVTGQTVDENNEHAWNIVIDENEEIILIDCTFASADQQHPERYFIYAPDTEFSEMHYVWDIEGKKYIPFKPKI